MSALPSEARRLGSALCQAPDHVLLRVLGLLEAQPHSGGAQALLDPARERLGQLRPRRPLRLPRLLFWPLDGAIRPAPEWERDRQGVPRTALGPLTGALRAAGPAEWAGFEREAAGGFFDDPAAVGPLGHGLWAFAERALPAAAPADWEAATGLRSAEHAPIAALCRAVWRHAPALWDVLAPGAAEAHLAAALGGPATEAPAVFEACLALLLRYSERPSAVLAAGARHGAGCARAAEAALDGLLAEAPPPLDARHPRAAAENAQRFAAMLLDISSTEAGQRPDRQRRIGALRREAAAGFRTTYDAGLEAAILGPAAGLAAASAAAAVAAVEQIEDAARDLRRLAHTGRQLDAGAGFVEREERLAGQLAALPTPGGASGLTPVDVARLVEILCGSEAARRFVA